MLALLLLLWVPVVMWLAQSVALKCLGWPLRWRIDSRGAPRKVRTTGRVVTQMALLAVIGIYPLLIHRTPWAYYAELLPGTPVANQLLQGAAASILFLCLLYAAWLLSGCLRIEVHQSPRRWGRRLALLVPTALFGAFMEELMFRGVLMADLLRSNPEGRLVAVGATALIFALAHYVRAVKRRWTFPGHVLLGILLSVAFLQTGTLWLPIGLHAGGILMIMGTRPFFEYRGPAWLTGASIFPFAGLFGLAGLLILIVFVWTRYGVP